MTTEPQQPKTQNAEKDRPDVTITLTFKEYIEVLAASAEGRISAELWDRMFAKAQEAARS